MNDRCNPRPPIRRDGAKLVYQSRAGEDFVVLPDGAVIIVHPDRPPKQVRVVNGKVEITQL